MKLEHAIQAILFYQAEPMSIGRLAKLLKKTEGEVRDALVLLREEITETGLALVENGNEVMLGTSPSASSLITEITKEELSKELSKAALETLAIVLYKGPITRAEIDYIRGVNSNFILRNLQVRGLVEKQDNPNDQRSYLYKATFQLFEYMGMTQTTDLPEYANTMEQLAAFIASKEDEEKPEKETGEGQGAEDDATGLEEEIPMQSDTELEADIADEDEAGEAYDDAELIAQREGDENTDNMGV